ncbi:hypothetical protein [Lacrimispora saccharolytica]|nr:hypothetical protein [Lacrimispora saccharolytica]QRV20563.1 hypothetical protein I6K70_03235 [Lacrimispora saccharolytica]
MEKTTITKVELNNPGWIIRNYQYYLGPVRNMMKAEIMKSHHIHCDETHL